MSNADLMIDADHSRVDEGTIVVHLTGEIDTATAAAFQAELQALIFTGAPRELVLDFAGITFMDSSGIRVIIDVQRRLREQDSVLVIESASPTTRQVLEVTGLTSHLELR